MSATPADVIAEQGGTASPPPGAGEQLAEPSAGPPPEPTYAPPPADDNTGPEAAEDDDVVLPEPQEVDDEEELEPKELPVDRVLIDRKSQSAVYTQKGLSYFGKIELYGLLGRAVEISMAGEGGLGINELMDLAKPKDMISQIMSHLPEADSAPDAQANTEDIDAGKMLAAFAKVISMAPDMLLEAYCIVLGIPKGHRKWAMDYGLPDGVDDEMGMDILHTFIDQNWGVMEDFFTRELPKIFKRAAKARQRHKSGTGR